MKLNFFLRNCVVPKPKKGGRKDENGNVIETRGLVCIRQYVTAIVDLWKHQVVVMDNKAPNPHGNVVKQYLASLETKTAKKEKRSYAEKGKGIVTDGLLTLEEIASISNTFLCYDTPAGTLLISSTHV